MLNFLNEDQRLLADSLSRYLEREHIPQVATEAESSMGRTPSRHWHQFAEMGLLGLGIPEEFGGLGDDPLAVHAVMELQGRHRVREPYAACAVLAARLLSDCAVNQISVRDQLQALSEGRQRLVLAHLEPQTDYTLENVEMRASPHAQGWMLQGRKRGVAYAAQADTLLVCARTSGGSCEQQGLSLFAVNPDAAGLRRHDGYSLDGAPFSDLHFDSVLIPNDSQIGPVGQIYPWLVAACADANAALCAESVGAMSAILEMTVAYAQTRRQFGASLGAFQAYQHRLVDMLIWLEKARSLAQRASLMLRNGRGHQAFQAVSAAKIVCCQAAQYIGQQAIQLHGGIGMTDELPLGHFVKRLMTISYTLGDEQHHLKQWIQSSMTHQSAAALELA